ncbi:MAG: hypothetical protein ACMUIP_06505 [bacterium]
MRLFSSRRQSLKAIKGLAKISIVCESRGIDKKFKAVFCLTRDGYGSIEGFGPFSTTLFKLVYNSKRLFLYLPREKTVYTAENNAETLCKILYFEWETVYLIDYLSANFPFDLSRAKTIAVSTQNEDFIMRGESSARKWIARLSDAGVPDIQKFCWLDKKGQCLTDISYTYDKEMGGYRLPVHIHFNQRNDNAAMTIRLLSVKVNEPVNEKDFIPPDEWLEENTILKKVPLS